MFKKLTLLAMAVGVLAALAVPAFAQATVKLTENGVALAANSEVTATSSDLVTETEKGILECEKVALHLEVLTNGPTHVVLKQLGTATTTNCGLNIGVATLPATIEDGTLGVGEGSELTINTWGTGETNATFVANVFADPEHHELLVSCHDEGVVHVQATGGSGLAVGPSLLHSESEGCAEVGVFHGGFSLETNDAGLTPVTIDFVQTP
jgi:hypothetical protein